MSFKATWEYKAEIAVPSPIVVISLLENHILTYVPVFQIWRSLTKVMWLKICILFLIGSFIHLPICSFWHFVFSLYVVLCLHSARKNYGFILALKFLVCREIKEKKGAGLGDLVRYNSLLGAQSENCANGTYARRRATKTWLGLGVIHNLSHDVVQRSFAKFN